VLNTDHTKKKIPLFKSYVKPGKKLATFFLKCQGKKGGKVFFKKCQEKTGGKDFL
jgi:hypothetical protein